MKANLKDKNIEEMADNGYFIIKSTLEWYFPGAVPSIQRTNTLWVEILNRLDKRGKKGLRVAGNMASVKSR